MFEVSGVSKTNYGDPVWTADNTLYFRIAKSRQVFRNATLHLNPNRHFAVPKYISPRQIYDFRYSSW